MMRTLLAGLVLLAALLFGVGALASVPPLPVELDPLEEAHFSLFEPMFGAPLSVQSDPDGTAAFYMGTKTAVLPSDTYRNIRFALFSYEGLQYPTVQLDSRGGLEGSGNPSHVVIFGWQDYKNYYYVYAAESPETRVARVVDGAHKTLYRHGSVIWMRDRDWYQELKVEVKPVNGETVVNTYVDGSLAMTYTFESGQEPPAGKVGIGGWNGAHSAYFKNVALSIQ